MQPNVLNSMEKFVTDPTPVTVTVCGAHHAIIEGGTEALPFDFKPATKKKSQPRDKYVMHSS